MARSSCSPFTTLCTIKVELATLVFCLGYLCLEHLQQVDSFRAVGHIGSIYFVGVTAPATDLSLLAPRVRLLCNCRRCAYQALQVQTCGGRGGGGYGSRSGGC